MSNLNKKILLFLMFVGLTLGLVGCANPDNSVRIRFPQEEYEIRLNETKVIEPTIIKSSQAGDIDLVYTSSDESIVKVVDGVLVPVAMGEATVKVEWANKDIIFDKVTVKVIKAALPKPVLNYEAAMLKNASQVVSVSLGNNLTEATATFEALTPEIAEITPEGKITAVAVGTAKFKVTVADYEESESEEFEVRVDESDFAIKYNLNGGENHAENPLGYSALELPLVLKEASKAGYAFLGWYNSADEKVEAIPAGTLGDVEVSAKWQIVEYTIKVSGLEGATFEGGYALPDHYTVESDEIVFAAPAKVGYKFLGYYAGEEKVEKVAKGSTGNVELVAKWEMEEYTISYETAHGQLPGYATVEDAIADFLADFNTARNKNHTVDTFKELGSWSEISDASLFLYNATYRAKWAWLVDYIASVAGKANKPAWQAFNKYDSQGDLNKENGNYIYEIAYELRGWVGQIKYTKNGNFHSADYSDSAVSAQMFDFCGVPTKYNVESEDIVLPVLETPGYAFLGWYNEADQKVEKIAKGSTGNVKVVAKWEMETYDIVYNLDGGQWSGLYSAHDQVVAEFLKDYSAYSKEEITTPAAYWKSGSKTSFWKNAEMHAKWSWIFEVLVPMAKAQGESTEYLENMLKDTPSVSGYATQNVAIFLLQINNALWNEQYKATYGGLSSKWTTVDCTGVTFEAYAEYLPAQFGRLTTEYTIVDAVSLPTPVKEDHLFLGWYKGDVKVEGIAAGSYGDVELTAKWHKIVRYPLTWNLDGGQWEAGKEGAAEFKEGEYAAVVLPTPVKQYHAFLGWFNAAGEKVEALTADQAYELTAKWEDQRIDGGTQYVLFVLDGGNWKEGQVPGVDVTDYVEVLKLIPAKAGYEFAEWVVESDNNTDPVTVIYTATWKKLEVYTISYELDGGVNAEGNPAEYTADQLPIALAPATKTGFNFLGWYVGDQKVEEIAAGTTGNLTLTAKWESNTVEITFELNGGEMAGNAPSFESVAAELLADFNKIGGTSLDPAGFAKGSSSAIKVVMANAEFLAKWNWFFAFAIEDLKAANPDATSEYLLDVYPALEESLKGEYAMFTGSNGANARTMIRNYIGGMLQSQKGCSSNTVFQAFATDFSDPARQAALVAAAPVTYTFQYETGTQLPVPTKEGYVFLGWFDGEEKHETALKSGSLSAKWEEEQVGPFTISYDLAGGQWGTAPLTSHEEMKAAFLADMTEYLISLGQKLESIDPVDQKEEHLTDFFGISYAQRDQIPAFFTTHAVYSAKWKWMYDYVAQVSGADLTNSTILRSNIHGFVYATIKEKWPVSHDFSSVTFGDYQHLMPASLGTQVVAPTQYEYGVATELPTPVKDGATFAGWTLNGQAFTGITAETKGDLALVATWK